MEINLDRIVNEIRGLEKEIKKDPCGKCNEALVHQLAMRKAVLVIEGRNDLIVDYWPLKKAQ
jgi:hypothetical protein